MKTIVIVTTSQPTANPRVVKEAKALFAAGYLVKVIYTTTLLWGDEMDKKIIAENPGINWVQASATWPQRLPVRYKYLRLRRKMYELLFIAGFKNISVGPASILLSSQLYKAVKKHPADLYIAHNLGALPVAAKAAKKYKAMVSFDAEDFHRGEDKEDSLQWKHAAYLEEKYFKEIIYLSVSAPLIATAYQKIFTTLHIFTVLNTFPISYLQHSVKAVSPIESIEESPGKNPLRLFWFSQSIGRGRGLEDVIQAMGLLSGNGIQLGLLGSISNENRAYFLSLMHQYQLKQTQVNFIAPVDEYQIAAIASTYDIGLAVETPCNANRDACLTNKIFMYLLAGNAIIFSDTAAQQNFYNHSPGIGFIYKSGKIEPLVAVLKKCCDDRVGIAEAGKQSQRYATAKFNWEEESKILVDNIQNIFAGNN